MTATRPSAPSRWNAVASSACTLRPSATVRGCVVTFVLACGSAVTTIASAQDMPPVQATVRYVARQRGVDRPLASAPPPWRCDARVPLAELVALQPGWDRRDPALIALRRWQVTVRRERRAFVAIIETVEDGAPGPRDEARDRTCGGLLDQVALNIARAVRANRDEAPSSPAPPPLPPEAIAPTPPVVVAPVVVAPVVAAPVVVLPLPPPPPPSPRGRWILAVGGSVTYGRLPGPISGGLALSLSVRREVWSLGAEVTGGRGGDASLVAGETLQGDELGGALFGCRHFGPVGLCGLVAGGAITLTRTLQATATSPAWRGSITIPWVSGGARVVAEWFPVDSFGLRARVDGAARLVWPNALTELTNNLWTPDSLLFTLGLDAALRW